jgi:uncharacterized cysteine cluster protein YcgN (CxxCxxCC family)
MCAISSFYVMLRVEMTRDCVCLINVSQRKVSSWDRTPYRRNHAKQRHETMHRYIREVVEYIHRTKIVLQASRTAKNIISDIGTLTLPTQAIMAGLIPRSI